MSNAQDAMLLKQFSLMLKGQLNAMVAGRYCAHQRVAKHDSLRDALLEEKYSANYYFILLHLSLDK